MLFPPFESLNFSQNVYICSDCAFSNFNNLHKDVRMFETFLNVRLSLKKVQLSNFFLVKLKKSHLSIHLGYCIKKKYILIC